MERVQDGTAGGLLAGQDGRTKKKGDRSEAHQRDWFIPRS